MQKKKISLKEWIFIGKYNHAAKWCRRLCSYSLVKVDDKMFRREQKINLFIYILIFIPIHILQGLFCLWDGGLKEFIIFSRNLGYDDLPKGSAAYERAKQVWEGSKVA